MKKLSIGILIVIFASVCGCATDFRRSENAGIEFDANGDGMFDEPFQVNPDYIHGDDTDDGFISPEIGGAGADTSSMDGIPKMTNGVVSEAVEDVDFQSVLAEGAWQDGDKTEHDTLVLRVDQDVTSGSSPTFVGTNFTNIPAGALATVQDWSGFSITFPAIPTLTWLASELDDTSDPHTLIAGELKNVILSNAESVGADEWDLVASAEGFDFSFFQEAAQTATLDPNGTEQIYFRRNPMFYYTQLAAGEAIVGSGVGKSKLDCKSTESGIYCTGDEGFDAATSAIPLNHFYKSIAFDPAAVCDGDENIIFIADVDDGFGSTLKLYKWVVEMTQDPGTEIDFDLMRADDYISETNSAVVDVLDTTSGTSSETTEANINGDAAIANSSVMYGKFGTSYEDTGEQVTLRIWGWWK